MAAPAITPAPTNVDHDALDGRAFTIPSIITLPNSIVLPSSVAIDISTVLQFSTVIDGVTIAPGQTIVLGGSSSSGTPPSTSSTTSSSTSSTPTPTPIPITSTSTTSSTTPSSTSSSASPTSARHSDASKTKILAGVFSILALLIALALCAGGWLFLRRRRQRRQMRDEDTAAQRSHSWSRISNDSDAEKHSVSTGAAMDNNHAAPYDDPFAPGALAAAGHTAGQRPPRRGSGYDPTPAFLPLMHPQGTYIPSDPRHVPAPPTPGEPSNDDVYYATPPSAAAGRASYQSHRPMRSDPFGDDADIMEVRRGEEDARAFSPASVSSSETLSDEQSYRHRSGYGPDADAEYMFKDEPAHDKEHETRRLRGGSLSTPASPAISQATPTIGPNAPPFPVMTLASPNPIQYPAPPQRRVSRRLPDLPAGALQYPYPPGRPLPQPSSHSGFVTGGALSPVGEHALSPTSVMSGTSAYYTPAASSQGHGPTYAPARRPSTSTSTFSGQPGWSSSSNSHGPATSSWSSPYSQSPHAPSGYGSGPASTPDEPSSGQPQRHVRTGSNAGYSGWFNRPGANASEGSEDRERLLPPTAALPDRFGPSTEESLPLHTASSVADGGDYFTTRRLQIANQ